MVTKRAKRKTGRDKLTTAQRARILEMVGKGRLNQREIAEKFGVSQSRVSQIGRGV